MTFQMQTAARVAAAAFSALLSVCGTSAFADTRSDWKAIADPIIQRFEGADFGAGEPNFGLVSSDFDCQGLSLGAKQHPFANGGINEVTRRIDDADLAQIISETMPRNGAVLLQAMREARAGKTVQARRTTLRLQNTVRLASSAPGGCSGGVKGVSLKAGVEGEIRAFLTHPKILAIQSEIANRLSNDALQLAACWSKTVNGADRPTFDQYLFFYDFIVQNGRGWLTELFQIVRRVKFGTQYGATPEKEIEKKVIYLRQWLETEWRIAATPKYYADSKYNAEVIRDAHAAGSLNADLLRLLYVKYYRSTLGNNLYSLPSMNRSVVILLGRGRVNVTQHDIQALKAKAGPLDFSEAPTTSDCP